MSLDDFVSNKPARNCAGSPDRRIINRSIHRHHRVVHQTRYYISREEGDKRMRHPILYQCVRGSRDLGIYL